MQLPRLESLLQGAGTLANPLHDITFTGWQFSYTTWNVIHHIGTDYSSACGITLSGNYAVLDGFAVTSA